MVRVPSTEGTRADDRDARVVSAEEVARELLGREVGNIVRYDPVARLDRDPEGVHQLRVHARRLRSELQFISPVVKSSPLRELGSELSWIGTVLGRLRDVDVLRQTLLSFDVAPSHGPSSFLVAELDQSRSHERHRVNDALDSRRYRQLIQMLTIAVLNPPFRNAATLSADDVFRPQLYQVWTLLFETVDKLEASPTNEELHRIRVLIKKSRYCTEIARSFLGADADPVAVAMANAQSLLGTLHDHALAASFLENGEKTRGDGFDSDVAQSYSSDMRIQLSASVEHCRRTWRGPLEESRVSVAALGYVAPKESHLERN